MSINGSSTDFLNGSTAGDTIKDITGTSFPPPTLVSFETVNNGAFVSGPITFDLTQVLVNTGPTAGNCTSNAALNSCTPANSPFTFAMDLSGTQLKISFTVFLNAYTGTSASGVSPYRAEFDATLSGNQPVNAALGACSGVADNITSILNCEAMGGTATASWSASESPLASPEPFSFVLFGSGLIGLSVLGRKIRRRN
jgi:hypothetical protein